MRCFCARLAALELAWPLTLRLNLFKFLFVFRAIINGFSRFLIISSCTKFDHAVVVANTCRFVHNEVYKYEPRVHLDWLLLHLVRR